MVAATATTTRPPARPTLPRSGTTWRCGTPTSRACSASASTRSTISRSLARGRRPPHRRVVFVVILCILIAARHGARMGLLMRSRRICFVAAMKQNQTKWRIVFSCAVVPPAATRGRTILSRTPHRHAMYPLPLSRGRRAPHASVLGARAGGRVRALLLHSAHDRRASRPPAASRRAGVVLRQSGRSYKMTKADSTLY